jgi:sigma-B regulation protein RsbU (phosphoserine phosphatase)
MLSHPHEFRKSHKYLFDTFQFEYFVTAVFIEFDQESGEAVICDMGHSYVLLMRGESLMRLGKRALNPPLGVTRDVISDVKNYRFGHGDLALIFTDGVVEQTNRLGEDYGEARLWKALRRNASLPAGKLREALSAELDNYRGAQPQGDDVTFLILRYK